MTYPTHPVALSLGMVSALFIGCSSNVEVDTPANRALSSQDVIADVADVSSSTHTRQQQTPSPAMASAGLDTEKAELLSKPVAEVARRTAAGAASERLQRQPRSARLSLDDSVIAPATPQHGENYQSAPRNRVIKTADQSTSTFSIDVDTGSYANVRRYLENGSLPPVEAVRVEELLNYFNYDYAEAKSLETPFTLSTELGMTPWNAGTRLLHIGLNGYQIDADDRPASNLVFLIDVSGSMNSANKLGLLKSSISLLSQQLRATDKVSIVVYAGASGVVLEPTDGNDVDRIRAALTQLNAGGSTNGEAGIELAYRMARQHFIEGGVNRVLLATDGDFNVGTSDVDALIQLIERERRSGVALTTLGFGTGNYNDHLMEQLADAGNGNYAYIDTLSEARKVLVDELTSTLLTVATDVKIQVEFNPAVVAEYRLIGYRNRVLANEDFSNDKVDAGDIGTGHTVTALYEIALHSDTGKRHETSRYQGQHAGRDAARSDEVAEIRLRYKRAIGEDSRLSRHVVLAGDTVLATDRTSNNFRFSAAVAGFGQLLSNSRYVEDYDLKRAAALAAGARGPDTFGYRREFLSLVELAAALQWQARAVLTPGPENAPDKRG